jgi:antirestriction protein ArdC
MLSHDQPTFAALLEAAVNQPGTLHAGYSVFWNYSIGNVLLALGQCHQRGIQPGPLATFQGWKEKGRYVRKGEKALTLCMPITVKRAADDEQEEATFTRFVFRPRWFTVWQTDAADYTPERQAAWDRSRALQALGIEEILFELFDGNCQGYATGRRIAISPVAVFPFKTTCHEAAHVLLHTGEGDHRDDDSTPRDLREVEAESVAMICCAALNLPGIESARAYVQSWWGAGNPIPEKSAQRILRAADQILKAGAAATQSAAETLS